MEREVAKKVDAVQYAEEGDIQKNMEQKERLRVEEKKELEAGGGGPSLDFVCEHV